MANTKFLAIGLSCLILVLVIELVRREKLTFKYAAGWLVASCLAIFLTVFDRLLFVLAQGLGFQLTSNFVFFAVLCVFVFLSLLLNIFLYQQDRRNMIMAQKMAGLEYELNELKKRVDQFHSEAP